MSDTSDLAESQVDRPQGGRSNSIPFPSSSHEQGLQESGSSSSKLTSSDKLSALPIQSSPVLERLRTPSRARRIIDASSSLSSIDSPSGSLRALQSLPGATRASESEGSIEKEIPRQRVSFESDRISLPATFQGIRQAVAARMGHRSDSNAPSPSAHSGEGSLRGNHQTPRQNQKTHQSPASHAIHNNNLSPIPGKEGFQTPQSRSPSQSRAASPLRLFGWGLHRGHSREEPFVPVDPFRLRVRWFGWRRTSSPERSSNTILAHEVEVACNESLGICLPLPALCSIGTRRRRREDDDESKRRSRWREFLSGATFFFADTLPRQVYLIFLLSLPALYWQRVARVFEDAEVSKPDIQRMIDACAEPQGEPSSETVAGRGAMTPVSGTAGHKNLPFGLPFPEDWTPPVVSPALVRFKNSWELFVDTLLREWKTFNLVSALLCTTILTIFQIQDAADDPLTRSVALVSLIFAIMSLSYGCVYIVHFGTMRSMDRASRWAEEAQRMKTAIWWNIWVLLATPAIWLAWSMITFCVAIMSFVWRTGALADQGGRAPLSAQQALGVRITISAIFALGLINFAMIIRTFGKYSRSSVQRDRRRGFGHRDGDGARTERPWERERGRGRRNAMEEERERDAKSMTSSMVGLGLTGVGEGGVVSPGSASVAGVVREDVGSEKGDFVSGEKSRWRGKISPKL